MSHLHLFMVQMMNGFAKVSLLAAKKFIRIKDVVPFSKKEKTVSLTILMRLFLEMKRDMGLLEAQ